MSAVKEKQKQEKELASSKANLMIADVLIDMEQLMHEGYISENEFLLIKDKVLNCTPNTRYGLNYVYNDIKTWIKFLKIGMINNGTFCNEITNILVCDMFDEKKYPALLLDYSSIKTLIINLSELGCKLISKDISQNKMTIIMKKDPIIITIIRYKTFYWREWKKKAIITDINGKEYLRSSSNSEIYNMVEKFK